VTRSSCVWAVGAATGAWVLGSRFVCWDPPPSAFSFAQKGKATHRGGMALPLTPASYFANVSPHLGRCGCRPRARRDLE